MIASNLLNLCRCCALRLEDESHGRIIHICVSSEGRIMPCSTIVARLPTSARASRQAACVPCWIAFIPICPAVSCLLMIIFI